MPDAARLLNAACLRRWLIAEGSRKVNDFPILRAMNQPTKHRDLGRRRFVKAAAWGAALLGALGALGFLGLSRRRQRPTPSPPHNPFAYDLTQLHKTDPRLIHYEQIGRIHCPHDDPRRITIGPDERLCIASGNYISVMDRDGGILSEIALAAPARCLAVAEDGLLYAGLRDHVEVFDVKGQRRSVWESPVRRTWFTGLAAGENAVFAADAGHRLVLRYDRSGKLLGRIGEKNPERGVAGFIVPSPYFDVELARDGLLRINNPGRHQVEAYTPDGDFEFGWGKASSAIDGFCGCCNPINVALLPDGRVVTCEKGLPRVKVYASDGTFESVVAGPESFPENARLNLSDDADGAQGGLDAAVDSNGRIYILDAVAGDVRIMAKKAGAAQITG